MVLKKILFVLVSFLFVLNTVSAFPFTSDVNGPSTVSLLEGMAVTIPLDIHNLDYRSHAVKITVDSESNFVSAKPFISKFTLNQYQSTTIGLEIHVTDDASHDLYTVNVEVDADGQKIVLPVNVYVGSNPFVVLNSFEGLVCGEDYFDEVSASIKNISSEDTLFRVWAEQSSLSPFVEPNEFTLDKGETQYLDIGVNVSPLKEGDFDGTLFAQSDTLLIARPFNVSVSDCPETVTPTIELIVPQKTITFSKLETTLVEVTVKNKTNSPQSITLTGYGEIASDIIHAEIGPYESAKLKIPFTPGLHVSPGIQLVDITAYTSNYFTTKSIKVNVLPLDYLEVSFLENVYEITEGEQEKVVLLISNKGDSTQNISVFVRDDTPEVIYSVSPSSFTLKKGENRTVSVSVLVGNDSSLVSVNNAIVVKGKKETILPFVFSVVQKIQLQGFVSLDFVSYPEKISMLSDDSKAIFVSLRNPSDKTVSDISFRLLGVAGSGIHLIPIEKITLLPFETKAIELTLVTDKDTKPSFYTPVLAADGKNAGAAQSFSLEVNSNGLGIFTGLITGIGDNVTPFGLIVLALIVLLWFASKQGEKTNPVWNSNKSG